MLPKTLCSMQFPQLCFPSYGLVLNCRGWSVEDVLFKMQNMDLCAVRMLFFIIWSFLMNDWSLDNVNKHLCRRQRMQHTYRLVKLNFKWEVNNTSFKWSQTYLNYNLYSNKWPSENHFYQWETSQWYLSNWAEVPFLHKNVCSRIVI